MAEKYIMMQDIISEHEERVLHLKKYYPFFALCDTAFSQYRDGKYADLDMGYITMATLRFLIQENHFQEREVTYAEYESFLLELLHREFGIADGADEERALCGYIFDKLKNDGKAFTFSYFDPEEKKKKISRVRWIDSRIVDGRVLYHVTTDGIAFYLDTKEVKEGSTLSVQQLLLEKMIRAENFAGGTEVVRRMNNEVERLSLRKNEVLDILRYDVFAGAQACREYMETAACWFDEETRLFEKNRALLDKAYAGLSAPSGEERRTKVLRDIHTLDMELKQTILRHGELIRDAIALQNIADEMIAEAKLHKLRPVFHFGDALQKIVGEDRPDRMHFLVMPLLMPKVEKRFAPECVDRMLEVKKDGSEDRMRRERDKPDATYVFPDETEEKRIAGNYAVLFGELLEQLWKHGKTTLSELMAVYELKFGREICRNGDIYSFLVHLAQKDHYDLRHMEEKQDTFLEGLVMQQFGLEQKDRYRDMVFSIIYDTETCLHFGEAGEYAFSVTDMRFEKD